MIPFFFIGSRRSGTTMLRYVLNRHPDIYCSFESGVMWVLRMLSLGNTLDEVKQLSIGKFAHIRLTFDYANDVFEGYERLADKSKLATRDAFFEGIHCCRRRRIDLEGKAEDGFLAVGEKNPSEYAEPDFAEFILETCPDVRFVHLIRHPVAFARSILSRIPDRNDIGYFLAMWVKHEQWVLKVTDRAPVFTIRYEDLCAAPRLWTEKLYLSLVPSADREAIQSGANIVKVNGNKKYNLSVPMKIDGLEDLMSMYGYS